MKVVVGLGNPEKEYENTRHNIGFQIVDYISKEYPEAEPSARYGAGGGFRFDKKSNSEIAEIKIHPVKSAKGGAALRQFNRVEGKKVLLAKPQTFMNKSGEAVKRIVSNFKFQISNLIIIHDDLDIPFGKTKISFGRSSAGHKGVQSVIGALKTNKFNRLRIGTFNQQIVKIRKIKDKRKRLSEMNKFVISPFDPSEKSKLNKLIKEAIEKLILVISDRL